MTPIGLGLGSNIGDKAAHVRRAAALLQERAIVPDLVLSGLYCTAPWGGVDQDWFINACAVGHTALEPKILLEAVKALEIAIGRTSTVRWGPRVIDIDILYFGDLALDTPDLVLPHREIMRRPFVLIPLAELAPDLALAGQRVADLAAAIDDGTVFRMADAST